MEHCCVGTASRLWALGPDGSRRSGWPVSLVRTRGSTWGSARYGFRPGPRGTVTVWWVEDPGGELCLEAGGTFFSVLGPDGRTLPGWPRSAKGLA